MPSGCRTTVKLGDVTVIEPSTLSMIVDGYDLASGVVMGAVETFETNESYPWHGAHSTAHDHSNGVRIALTNDLSLTPYTLEIRAFDDGVAYRFVVPGEDGESRVPDEYSTFVLARRNDRLVSRSRRPLRSRPTIGRTSPT